MKESEQPRPQAFGFTPLAGFLFAALCNVKNQQAKENNRKPRGETQQQRLIAEEQSVRYIFAIPHIPALHPLTHIATRFKRAVATRGKIGLRHTASICAAAVALCAPLCRFLFNAQDGRDLQAWERYLHECLPASCRGRKL